MSAGYYLLSTDNLGGYIKVDQHRVKYLYFIGSALILIVFAVLYYNLILKPSQVVFNIAVEQMEDKDYTSAMNSFQKVKKMDFIRYSTAQDKYDKCKKTDENILGIWERYGDGKAGMQVKVTKDHDGYSGKIIKSPPACQEDGFFVGEIKWRNITRQSDTSFNYYDLWKSSYDDDKTLFEGDYKEAIIELDDDWTKINLNMKVIESNDPSLGQVQTWNKITS